MEQNLSFYKIFYTVASCGNISHAAKKLYISQPAISKSITKLEENLGVLLFFRNSRGVSLTDEGKLLYEHLSLAFDSITIAEKTLQNQIKLGVGHIKIGVSTTLCKYVLLPYLKDFTSLYPHIKITIDCQSTYQTINLLENNKIDLGLIRSPEKIPKHLIFKSIGEIEDIFVATDSYIENLLIRYSSNKLDIFKNANLMLLDKGNITREYIDNYFKAYAIESEHVLEINNMDLLIEFAKIGLGIACVVKEFVTQEINDKILTQIELPNPINKGEIGFVYNKNSTLSLSTSTFIDFLNL